MVAHHAPAEIEKDIICANVVQNNFFVSTPTEKNARAYVTVEALLVGSTEYEVNSYPAAPENTCKGIVRGVDLDFDNNQLLEMIVQPRSLKALEVKRIKDTTSLFCSSSLFCSMDSKCQIMSCVAPACFAVRSTNARRTFAGSVKGWVTVPTCA
ncbi:hypothetical protein HPB51_015614 [Rhipicephalus microplus]|uniref:Uncharacterized protein n=1 Tax=Rhipicephalus microplus TaxID=6941 RepID=A0A9J6DHG1_RHIMP|nr:hypothetical protein HPB51_015614 [Rhipicephalus microplus]